MDEYKQYFYQTVPAVFVPPPVSGIGKSSLEPRKKLRKKLKCKPFSWYLRSVVVDVYAPTPNSYLFGQFKSVENLMCAFVEQTNHITFNSCYFSSRDYYFSFTHDNRIISMLNNLCLTMTEDGTQLTVMQVCREDLVTQLWSFVEGLIPDQIKQKLIGVETRKPVNRIVSISGHLNLCLAAGKYFSIDTILIKPCDTNDPAQYQISISEVKKTRIVFIQFLLSTLIFSHEQYFKTDYGLMNVDGSGSREIWIGAKYLMYQEFKKFR